MAPEVQVLPHRPSVYSLSGALQAGMAGRIAYPGPKLRSAGKYRSDRYWESENGLDMDAKEELFDTVDVEYALRLIAAGISECVRVDRSG